MQFTSFASDCQHGNCTYGEEIFDYGCYGTYKECGRNMIFIPIFKTFLFEYSLPYYYCKQRCVCINNKYIRYGEKCIRNEFPETQKVNWLIIVNNNNNDNSNINNNNKCTEIYKNFMQWLLMTNLNQIYQITN